MTPFDKPIRDPEVLRRMRILFDLCESAELIMRQNIRRWHPDLGEAEVEERLAAWRRERPDAPLGDAYGRPSAKWARKFGLRS